MGFHAAATRPIETPVTLRNCRSFLPEFFRKKVVCERRDGAVVVERDPAGGVRMRRFHGAGVFRELERPIDPGTVAGLTESELVARFVDRRDPVAFEAIVSRHGPMVLSVCRVMLADANDVDDAFQATFAILIEKARRLRRPERLGPWLHGVAYRVAHRARARGGSVHTGGPGGTIERGRAGTA